MSRKPGTPESRLLPPTPGPFPNHDFTALRLGDHRSAAGRQEPCSLATSPTPDSLTTSRFGQGASSLWGFLQQPILLVWRSLSDAPHLSMARESGDGLKPPHPRPPKCPLGRLCLPRILRGQRTIQELQSPFSTGRFSDRGVRVDGHAASALSLSAEGFLLLAGLGTSRPASWRGLHWLSGFQREDEASLTERSSAM